MWNIATMQTAQSIDNYFGCIKRYLNKEEAENPLKSRQ